MLADLVERDTTLADEPAHTAGFHRQVVSGGRHVEELATERKVHEHLYADLRRWAVDPMVTSSFPCRAIVPVRQLSISDDDLHYVPNSRQTSLITDEQKRTVTQHGSEVS